MENKNIFLQLHKNLLPFLQSEIWYCRPVGWMWDEVQCLSRILTGDVWGHKVPSQSEALAETQRQQNHSVLCKAYGPPEHTGQDEREEETTPTTQPETRMQRRMLAANTLFQHQQMKFWSPEKNWHLNDNFLSAVKIKRVHFYWVLTGVKLAENFFLPHTSTHCRDK